MSPGQKAIVSSVIALLIAGAIKTYLFQALKITSDGMAPTLQKGDRVIVDKNIYKKSEPQRGDIVIYISPQRPNKKFIHRIVGLPNETIEINNGSILVNGTVLKSLWFENMPYDSKGAYAKQSQPVEVPSDSYFILGDNSASSNDGRFSGFLPKKNIVGKAVKIYYPFKRAGSIK